MACVSKPSLVTDKYRHLIAAWIASKNPSITKEFAFNALEMPKNATHGDFSLPVPKLRLPGNPSQTAAMLATKFQQAPVAGIQSVSTMGIFLNFSIDLKQVLADVVREIDEKQSKYGWNEFGKGKNIVIDYASPNIAKPFHAGHLRSSVIGNFLKHIYTANGYRVTGINYLGDWGKQYGLLALGYLKYGNEEHMKIDAIKHLFDVYVKISADANSDPSVHEEARAYFKRMEEGNAEALELWSKFRTLSITKYEQVFGRLNIKFDVYSGESHYESAMKDVIRELEEKNLLIESNGAKVVDLSEEKLGKPLILKSDGTTLYLTRDIAAAIDRENTYSPEQSLYVVCSSQTLHFQQLAAILKRMGYSWAQAIKHVNYGTVTGMSTRRGNVVFLEDILDEAYRTMYQVMKSNEKKFAQIEDPEAVANALAVSAIVIQDFSAKKIKDYEFSMERMTSFEGDTGPYLQYTHVRLCSIARKASEDQLEPLNDDDDDVLMEELGSNESVLQVAKKLAVFPSIVVDACQNQEPNTLVTYLMSLCHLVSALLEHLPVLHAPSPRATAARLRFFAAVRQVLANGITLLGLPLLTRM